MALDFDVLDGYCLPMLAELQDVFCYQSTDFRKTGTLDAVMSERNKNAPGAEFMEKYDMNGTPVESVLRWYREECSKAVAAEVDGICVAGDAIDAFDYLEIKHGTVWTDSKKWTIAPCDMNNLCFDNVRSARARQMQKWTNKIIENANGALLDGIIAAAGGTYDHRTNAVTAAGTQLSFNVIGPAGTPSAKDFNDMNRFFSYNGCSVPMVVHGDNAMVDYIRHQQLGAYCCNQDGINLPNLSGFLGFENYLDNSGGLSGAVAYSDAVAFEPGAVRIRDSYTGRGDCTWAYPDHGKITFVGPYGLVFDYRYRIDDCTGALTELIELNLEFFYKPLGVNDCDLAGTNGIFYLEFLSCAEDSCPEPEA